MTRIFSFLRLSYGQKLSLVAAIPLILAVAAIAALVAVQARALAEREIKALEIQLLAAKKVELRNYVTQARNGFYFIYGNAAPDDEDAKKQVSQILSAMIYGTDGFFFVYDYDGTNLVSPRQTERINQNWSGETNSEGVPVVDELLRIARSSSSSCAASSRAYCVSRDAVFFLFLLFLAIAYLWRKCPLQVSGGARERQRRPKAGDHLAAAEGQLF